jgi:hypothetical protein
MKEPLHIAIDIADTFNRIKDMQVFLGWILSSPVPMPDTPESIGLYLIAERLDSLVPDLEQRIDELLPELKERKQAPK